MADPVLPGVIRVQAILQGKSALPEDRYVTTWAFTSDVASSDAGKAAAIARVRDFYVNVSTAGGNIASKLAGQHISVPLSELRAYDLGDPIGFREPYIEPFGLPVLSTTTAMPSEVAVCLSYFAGVNSPRTRGRVFLGPFTTAALGGGAPGPGQVFSAFVLDIVAQADTLASLTTFPRWCLISTGVEGGAKEARIITDGWVDNAFDTMRKRGEAATLRTTFSTA